MSEVSIIIPTKNGGADFAQCLGMVHAQRYEGKFEVIAIDSGSTDDTLNTIKGYPTKLLTIKPEDFGHGKTRNLAARLAEGRYLVFVSQDSIPASTEWLSKLTRNFEDPEVIAVHGKQIPRKGTNPVECFFLNRTYPDYRKVSQQHTPKKTTIEDIFLSTANAAIRRDIFEGSPFSEEVLCAIDVEWTKRMILSGLRLKIVYDPEAKVFHSHNFTLLGVLQKYFDYGVDQRRFMSGEYTSSKLVAGGLNHVKEEVKFLARSGNLKWIPYAHLYDFCKFLGLSLGQKERYLPLALKKQLSMHSYYWHE